MWSELVCNVFFNGYAYLEVCQKHIYKEYERFLVPSELCLLGEVQISQYCIYHIFWPGHHYD